MPQHVLSCLHMCCHAETQGHRGGTAGASTPTRLNMRGHAKVGGGPWGQAGGTAPQGCTQHALTRFNTLRVLTW